jgi:predicted transcriptional regulator
MTVRDFSVYNELTSDWKSVADFKSTGFWLDSVRSSLKRLVSLGRVERRWEGTKQNGRYLYRLAEIGAQ